MGVASAAPSACELGLRGHGQYADKLRSAGHHGGAKPQLRGHGSAWISASLRRQVSQVQILPWAPSKTAPDQQFLVEGLFSFYPVVSGPIRRFMGCHAHRPCTGQLWPRFGIPMGPRPGRGCLGRTPGRKAAWCRPVDGGDERARRCQVASAGCELAGPPSHVRWSVPFRLTSTE